MRRLVVGALPAVLLATLLLGLTLGVTTGRATPPAPVLITAVLYDGYESGDRDEAVQITNVGTVTVTLAGWYLTDGSQVRAILPAGTALAPGEGYWLTWEATAFRRQFGHRPDMETAASDPTVLQLAGSWPGFANAGDEVLLYDADGLLADALVYGASSAQTGWQGPALQPYTVSSVFGASGQVLFRQWDPSAGAFRPDSDRAADWAQDDLNPVAGRRVRYPGWDSDRFRGPVTITTTEPLTIAVAPDNAFGLVVDAIGRATTSIQIESLTYESVAIGDALAAAAARGVTVTLLLEGGPIGGISNQEKYLCQRLASAGGHCWFMVSDAPNRIFDRYRFLHAKFILIDNLFAIVSSENLSPNSLPDDDKSDGTWGRRGVLFQTAAPQVVAQLAAIFAADFDPDAHGDLRPWSPTDPTYGPPPPGYVPITASGGTTYTVRFPVPQLIDAVMAISVIQAPENALQLETGLLALLAAAGTGDTILVQQLLEHPYWGPGTSDAAQDPNIRLEAYLAAARRGTTVRLLLDSFFSSPADPRGNHATCIYVNTIAAVEGLDLACETANPAGLGIHNKMVLLQVGGEGYALVGSWNGSELSAKGNREVALLVAATEAYSYLADLFFGDWPKRQQFPVIRRQYVAPAQHAVISELLYNPAGPDDREYVELFNPTSEAIDLTLYSLSDAVHPGDFEDLRRFPSGTTLPAGGVLVVATAATAFSAEYGFAPDFEILASDPAVPQLIDDPDWGSPETFLQFGNGGDEVLLRDPDGQLVDGLSYGTGNLPGHLACELLPSSDQVLERFPPWRDTDTCPVDFRAWPFASPGTLP